jgi:hypothetical protein
VFLEAPRWFEYVAKTIKIPGSWWSQVFNTEFSHMCGLLYTKSWTPLTVNWICFSLSTKPFSVIKNLVMNGFDL